MVYKGTASEVYTWQTIELSHVTREAVQCPWNEKKPWSYIFNVMISTSNTALKDPYMEVHGYLSSIGVLNQCNSQYGHFRVECTFLRLSTLLILTRPSRNNPALQPNVK